MIDSLKPYPCYKDSGVPWLDRVPSHWEVSRLKRLCRLAYGDSLPDETRRHGNTPVYGSNGRVGTHDSANTRAPCIVVGRKGSFGKVNYSVQPVFAIDTTFIIDNRFTKANLRWLWYVMGSLRLDSASRDSAVPGLARENVYRRVASYPPDAVEQSSIARFLDHAERRIRRYIAAKKKLIVLLNEQKQAIINRAVTRGLDPNVQLKPSGVEWLGDVPEHWMPYKLKHVAAIQTGVTLGKNYGPQLLVERPYLRVANVQTGRLDLSLVKTIHVPASEAAGTSLKQGDVLMTEGGDIDKLGRGCVWNDEIPGSLHQNHIFAVRPRQEALRPDFLVAVMASHHGRSYFETTAKKTTNLASTNSTTLGNFPLYLPSVEEQRWILEWIALHTRPLSEAQARTEREIAFVREYCTRLIADVVAGKLDVRDAAANLPDEPEDLETPEEADALAENREEDDSADPEATIEDEP